MLDRMTARASLTTPSRRRPSRRGAAAAALSFALIASLALAGCGGKEKESSGETPEATSTEDGTVLPAIQPLTGLPAKGELPKHSVMFVKVDNSSASDPQIGLGSADMVFEQLVEGGYTRLAVAFYSKLPKVAGPVRSARATDIGIVLPTKGALIASGAAGATKRRLSRTGVNYFEEGVPGTYRDRQYGHDQLHSVFIDLEKFAKSRKRSAAAPANYLPWGTESDFTGVQPAKKVTVRFSPTSSTLFTFKNGKYVNGNGLMRQGDEFKPDTILVLRVKSGDAGYRDPNGSPVPESFFYGKGQAVLFHQGQAVRGTWVKPTRSSPLALKTAAGPLLVPPGKVWVSLLPRTEGDPKLTFK